jgi:hypothetical protein
VLDRMLGRGGRGGLFVGDICSSLYVFSQIVGDALFSFSFFWDVRTRLEEGGAKFITLMKACLGYCYFW